MAEQKHPSARQRRNIAASRALLKVVDPDEPLEIPEMPRLFRNVVDQDTGEITRREIPYEIQSILAWEAWWRSPMRQEWTEADYYGICRLIMLEDQFWKNPNGQNHTEIRLAQKDYGLTPLDRRRLEWTIEQADEAQDKGRKRRQRTATETNGPKAAPPPDDDPRGNLDATG